MALIQSVAQSCIFSLRNTSHFLPYSQRLSLVLTFPCLHYFYQLPLWTLGEWYHLAPNPLCTPSHYLPQTLNNENNNKTQNKQPTFVYFLIQQLPLPTIQTVKDKQSRILVNVVRAHFNQQYAREESSVNWTPFWFIQRWLGILKGEWGNREGVSGGLGRVRKWKNHKKWEGGVGLCETHLALLTSTHWS